SPRFVPLCSGPTPERSPGESGLSSYNLLPTKGLSIPALDCRGYHTLLRLLRAIRLAGRGFLLIKSKEQNVIIGIDTHRGGNRHSGPGDLFGAHRGMLKQRARGGLRVDPAGADCRDPFIRLDHIA